MPIPFDEANPIYHITRTVCRSALHAFFPIKILHQERLIEEGPCVVVANHQSFLDPPLVGTLYHNPIYFLARKTLFDPPIMKQFMPFSHSIPVDQDNPNPSSILQVIRTVRNGNRLLIFPEGTRCSDNQIHDAMPGIGLILSKLANIPVQPIRIEGAYDCLPIHSSRLRFRPITLSVGDPIQFSPEELKVKGREAHLAIGRKVMDAIRALPIEA